MDYELSEYDRSHMIYRFAKERSSEYAEVNLYLRQCKNGISTSRVVIVEFMRSYRKA